MSVNIEHILRVTRRLFVERGFHSVTIPDIVQASGVSTGAIYHRFKGKESLARYIYQRTLAEFQQSFALALDGKATIFDKLAAFSRLVLAFSEEDPDCVEYMLFMRHGEFLNSLPPICSTTPFLMVQEIVADGMASGEVRPGNVLVAAASYTGVLFRVVKLSFEGVITDRLSEMEEDILKNAWAAIAA